jgi:hypothetical protein
MQSLIQGVKCVLLGLTSKQRHTISNNIICEGSFILEKSLWSSSVFIFTDKKEILKSYISKSFDCSESSLKNKSILHHSSIVDSVKDKSVMSEVSYKVEVSKEKSTESACNNSQVTRDKKRQKINDVSFEINISSIF